MSSVLTIVTSRRGNQPWVRLPARDTTTVRLSTRDTAASGKSFLSSHTFMFVPSGCVLNRERNIGRLSRSWSHTVVYVLVGVSIYGTSKRQPLLAVYFLVLLTLVLLTPVLLPPLLPLPRPLMSPPCFQPNNCEYARCSISFDSFQRWLFFTLFLFRTFIHAV